MKRYCTMPHAPAAWDDDYPRATDHLPRTVHEQDRLPVPTGLLDKDGRPIFTVEERNPIGFVWPKDRP